MLRVKCVNEYDPKGRETWYFLVEGLDARFGNREEAEMVADALAKEDLDPAELAARISNMVLDEWAQINFDDQDGGLAYNFHEALLDLIKDALRHPS